MDHLSRRERQVLETVVRLGRCNAAEVSDALGDEVSYSAARAALAALEGKGLVRHRREGRQYVYASTTPLSQTRRKEVRRLLRTFFDDSIVKTMNALIEVRGEKLGDEELDELASLIEAAYRKGR